MKNFFKFLGVISLTLVMGFSMAACKDDADDGGDESFTVQETSGKLTISGLGSYNGKYVKAQGYTSTTDIPDLIAYAQIDLNAQKVKGGIVANGSVTLKVWKMTGTGYNNYTGNDKGVMFAVMIDSTETGGSNSEIHVVTVNFTNGVGTASITTTP
jgi:hypothetical protein